MLNVRRVIEGYTQCKMGHWPVNSQCNVDYINQDTLNLRWVYDKVMLNVEGPSSKVGSTNKSCSEHVLWTYPTPSPTNWALYLSRVVQNQLRTILSLYNHIKYELKHFFHPIFDHNYLYLYVKPSLHKEYIPLYSL